MQVKTTLLALLMTLFAVNVYGIKDATTISMDDVPFLAAVPSYGSCTGAKIHANVVLTAAHCVDYPSVRGATLLVDGTLQGVAPVGMRIHRDWSGDVFDAHDIALVFLNEYSDAPSIPLSTRANVDNMDGTAYGWKSDTPVTRTMTIPTNALCKETFDHKFITDDMVCFGPGEKEVIEPGDSGGPLTIMNGGREELVGVTSFNKAWDSVVDYYAAYTRVAHFVDWIEDIVGVDLHSDNNLTELHPLYEGSFETDDYWLKQGSNIVVSSSNARTGSRLAWFDGNEGTTANIVQRFQVTSGLEAISFWIKIPSWDEGSTFNVSIGSELTKVDVRDRVWEVNTVAAPDMMTVITEYVGSREIKEGAVWNYHGKYAVGQVVSVNENKIIREMYAHVHSIAPNTATSIRGILYRDVPDEDAWEFVATTGVEDIVEGWNHMTFPAPVELVAGETYLLTQSANGKRYLYYNGRGGSRVWDGGTIDFDDPEGSGPQPVQDVQHMYHYSVYAPTQTAQVTNRLESAAPGELADWTQVEIDIEEYAGNDVMAVVRFESTLASNTDVYLDDVSVIDVAPTTTTTTTTTTSTTTTTTSTTTTTAAPATTTSTSTTTTTSISTTSTSTTSTTTTTLAPAVEESATTSTTLAPPVSSDGSGGGGGCFVSSLSL